MLDHYPDSVKFGESVSQLFAKIYAEKTGQTGLQATPIQDKLEHWDWSFDSIKFDVKSKKRRNRYDDHFAEDEMLIELTGITGYDGWIKGQADYIVQQRFDHLIVINRAQLLEFYESNSTRYPLTKPRKDRQDQCAWIPYDDFLPFVQFKILTPKPMNYTPQPNSFTLFANDKGDNPKRPDYRGDAILPDGTKMKLSCWIKESANGKKFLSGKMEPMQEQENSQKQGSDLPF